MKIEELLIGKQNCECGKNHICPIEKVIIEENAFLKIPELVENYNKILLVADTNTYAVAGEQVKTQLKEKLGNLLIYKRKGILVPDEVALQELREALTSCEGCDLVIGIGSGVINDLCKEVSFEAKLPYFIVATAPSMDGYASKGSALILNGMKVTLNAETPKVILADVDVLKDAPFEMIQAGYGDIVGKYSCLNDWKLAKVVIDEYFCPFIYEETMKIVDETVNYATDLVERKKSAVGALMKALVAVGIFMAYVGNSRPASGSEHHLSHFFEVVGILRNEEYFAHGIDVCYSAIETAKVREKWLKVDDISSFNNRYNEKEYIEDIKNIYGKIAEEIFALQKSAKNYEVDRVEIYKKKWAEIQQVLKIAPTAQEMIDIVEKIGLSYKYFKEFYGEEKIESAINYAKDLKDRYSVLWLNYELGYRK